MDDENLRIRAMDFAIAARTSQHEDIVELAQRIYAFLDPQAALSPKGTAALKAHVDEIQSEQSIPPPLPAQYDLARADQSPLLDASDTPTRIVRPQVLASTAEGDLVVGEDDKTCLVYPFA